MATAEIDMRVLGGRKSGDDLPSGLLPGGIYEARRAIA